MTERAPARSAGGRPAPSREPARVAVVTAGKTSSTAYRPLIERLADKLASRGPVAIVDIWAGMDSLTAVTQDLGRADYTWEGRPVRITPRAMRGQQLADMLRLCADVVTTAETLARQGWSLVL